MSLQVWLPLNGNLNNYGLTNVTVTNNGATVNDSGKIGKCYAFNGSSSYIEFSPVSLAVDNSICCWLDLTNISSTQYFISFSSYRGIRYGTDNQFLYYAGSSSVTWTYTKVNRFVHVAFVCNSNTVTLYVDGVSLGSRSFTAREDCNGIGKRSDGYYYNGKMNDFRIYDHCLSIKEIQEIAKALVLHYKLDDNTIEATQNLVSYPSIEYELENVGWDESKHQGAMKVRNWNTGYNSGVTDPSHGYHGCWKIIDGELMIVLPDINSEISQTHRWIAMWGGLANQNINDWQNRTYTISFDARADVDNKYISSGLYYKKTSDGSNSFHDTLETIVLSKKWKRYSFTRTTTTVYSVSSIFIYGHNGTVEGTSYIKNIQLEFNDHATEYAGIIGSRPKGFIIDSSGYGYNGVITRNLSAIQNSPRYKYSTLAEDTSNYSIITYNNFNLADGPITISFWSKPTINSTDDTSKIDITFSNCHYFTYRNYTYFIHNGDYKYKYTNPWADGKWHFITCLFDGTNTKIYVDGINISVNTNSPSTEATTFLNNLNIKFRGNYLSDFRIYATALSEQDIKDLYNMAGYVDNLGNLEFYDFDEQTENLFDIDDFKKNLILTSANIHYEDRNGEQAVAIQPNWFYNNSNYYSIISTEKFLPNTQYKFDIWIDTDNVVSSGNNVAAGLRIYYEGGSSSTLTKTGNQANPKGWQHISFISNKNTTISKVGVYYYTWIPGYYRWDSTITPMISTSQINQNGIYETGQFREDSDIAQICQGDHFDANHFIEI